MNKQKIEEIEKAIKELQGQVEDLKNPKTPKRFRAKIDSRYECINTGGEIIGGIEDNHEVDQYRYDSGNYFDPETGDARSRQAALVTQNELRSLSEFESPWPFKGYREFYFIQFHFVDGEMLLELGIVYSYQEARFGWSTSEARDKAVETIGEQRLIDMYKAGVLA